MGGEGGEGEGGGGGRGELRRKGLKKDGKSIGSMVRPWPKGSSHIVMLCYHVTCSTR